MFCTQLKLLLWKNFTLRKRNKKRAVIEILAPLALFIILVLVRSKDLTVRIPSCNFESKSMPSAGFIPFMQKLICTANNTCNSFATSENMYEYVVNYKDSVLTSSMASLQSLVNNKEIMDLLIQLVRALNRLRQREAIKRNADYVLQNILKTLEEEMPTHLQTQNFDIPPEILNSLLDAEWNYQNLSLILPSIQSEDFQVAQLFCNSSSISLFLKFKNPLQLQTFTDYFCSFNQTTQKTLIQTFIQKLNQTNKQRLVRDLNFSAAFSENPLMYMLDKREELTTLFLKIIDNQALRNFSESMISFNAVFQQAMPTDTTASLNSLLCGESESLVAKLQNDAIFKKLQSFMQDPDVTKYSAYDNTTSSFCNDFFASLEKNMAFAFLWKPLKPIVQGKILYTPDTPATRKIIAKVNKTFEDIENFKKLADLWLMVSPTIRSYIKSNQSVVITFLKAYHKNPSTALKDYPLIAQLLSTILTGTFSNNITSILTYFGNFFSDNGPLVSTMDSIDSWTLSISSFIQCIELNKFEPVHDENTLVEYGRELLSRNKIWAGIVFENMLDDANDIPSYISYKIRMDSGKVDSTKTAQDRYWRPGTRARPSSDLKYFTYGFIYLQDLVDHAIIQLQTGTTEKVGIYLQQFPYPCYVEDKFFTAISRTLPLFMVLSWVYTVAMLIKAIVYEKEKRLKEIMKVMGLSNEVHWVAWFIDGFIIMFITIILLILLLKFGNVLMNTDVGMLFLFFISFAVATIMLSFLISVFFSKANLAAAAGGVIYFFLYLPYTFLVNWESQMSHSLKILSCLLSNVALGFGCNYLARYEEQMVGVQWSNWHLSPAPGDTFSLAACIGMLIFDSFLYGFLAWYIEHVFPGEYGIPKPFYFLCTKQYWFGKDHRNISQPVDHDLEANNQGDSSSFEKDPTHLPLGVAVYDLTKVYSDKKVAVDRLTVNFYEGQITSFLGHNGAGKTTTISVLTGIFPPTRGTAKIYGKDIRTEMDPIRKSLGTCPQHNVLFDNLTVEEHLWFYGSLKGAPSKEVNSEVDQMIKDIGLPHKRKELSKKLSGGMQRKLSLAIAFVGNSKTVILDEPTSGVDPYARRSIWDLLLKYKKDRTIILTTHHMDEADLLGDRIAIISQGKLVCCGSSLFLKAHYGKGYYLTLVKKDFMHSPRPPKINDKNHEENPGSEKLALPSDEEKPEVEKLLLSRSSPKSPADPEPAITAFIQKYVPDAQMVENLTTEITYCLPFSHIKTGAFEKLFDALDKDLGKLGVSSYGISDTSLEEIFLKVTEEADEGILDAVDNNPKTNIFSRIKNMCLNLRKSPKRDNQNIKANNTVPEPEVNYCDNKVRIKGRALMRQQFYALLIKRFNHTKRSRKGCFCEIILPVIFVLIAMIFALIMPPVEDEPPLEINPWLYGPPNYIFYSVENKNSKIGEKLAESLIKSPGIGTRCMTDEPVSGKPCVPAGSNPNDLYVDASFSHFEPYGECSCESGFSVCSEEAAGPPAPNIVTDTTDILLNMKGRNITDWIVATTFVYKMNRNGGFVLGVENQLASLNSLQFYQLMDEIAKLFNITLGNFSELLNIEAMITENNVNVWFDNKAWAASVAYMNVINNAILRTSLPSNANPEQYGISVTNHPLNFTKSQLQNMITNKSMSDLFIAICIIFALSFVPASFVLFLIDERVSNAKHLQLVSGVNPAMYWTANFIWDMGNYLIPVFLCVIIFAIFNEAAYTSPRNAPVLISLFILYGWAIIPLMYPASFIFSVPSSAFVTLSCLNLFIGMTTTVSTFILELLADEALSNIATILRQLFLIFPQYCLGRGLMDMASNQLQYEMLQKFGLDQFQDPFAWNSVGRNLCCMFVQGIVFFFIVILIEYRFFYKPKVKSVSRGSQIAEDDDVANERERVLSGDADSDVLRLENLTKVYHKKKYAAVDHLCVGVPSGECFGLLGVNGAGKTTTFKMLTGQISVTSGNAYLSGYSILTDIVSVHQNMGYCPQFNALHSLLTGREHLTLYARLRGIPEDKVNEVVTLGIRQLGLQEFSNKSSYKYSGGNKRKLSTAIALIGCPPVIFLDEPTAGMDPKARRFLWNCIIDITKNKCVVILTSHSMAECEALCTRLAIMVNGQFQCIGSTQHLKNKFGEGYTLVIKLGGTIPKIKEMTSYIEEKYPTAVLKESHNNQLQYQLPLKDLKLSYLFSIIESVREELEIEDYSISQTTLDQVFITFAKQQTDLLDEEAQTSADMATTEEKYPTTDFELEETGSSERRPTLAHLIPKENGSSQIDQRKEAQT